MSTPECQFSLVVQILVVDWIYWQITHDDFRKRKQHRKYNNHNAYNDLLPITTFK